MLIRAAFACFIFLPATVIAAVGETTLAPTPVPLATPSPSSRHVVTLAQAIDLALHYNPDLIARLAASEQADAHAEQARAASFPKVLGTAILSPIYGAHGNALQSENDIHQLGVWVQSSITILQPIYTWGKLSNLREAAARGLDVSRAQSRHDTLEITYAVKELFYGAVLAEELYNFLEEGHNQITELLAKAEADQKLKRPTIAKRDYYRLKLFAAEADYRLNEAQKLRFLAHHALAMHLGFDPDDEAIPQETVLRPIEGTLPTEDTLVQKMSAVRPEFQQLQNGILAKQALLKATRADLFPMLFVGGLLNFAYSNVRDGQQSAFAYDPYNRDTGGVGLGAQWNWDFATTLANQSLLRAEIDELEKKQSFARVGFRMELKKALAELKEAQEKLSTSNDAFQVGKRWLVSETMGYSMGLTEIKNLVDAYLARAKTAEDRWRAVYQVNMSWAQLTKTIGTEITPGLGTPL